MPRASNPLFVPPNWLLHMERHRTIYGSRFDPSSLQIMGDAILLLDGVGSPNGFAAYTAAANALVALPNVEPLTAYLSWIDRREQSRKSMGIDPGVGDSDSGNAYRIQRNIFFEEAAKN